MPTVLRNAVDHVVNFARDHPLLTLAGAGLFVAWFIADDDVGELLVCSCPLMLG
jgi:hypothetical protein